MEKKDRTGEVMTNLRGQSCRITEYRNCHDITVEIVDTRANKMRTLHRQRYARFKHGLVFFTPQDFDDDWRNKPTLKEHKPEIDVTETYTYKAFAQCSDDEDAVQGKAIGITLLLIVSVFAILFVLSLLSLI
jgi:hypothetical protein